MRCFSGDGPRLYFHTAEGTSANFKFTAGVVGAGAHADHAEAGRPASVRGRHPFAVVFDGQADVIALENEGNADAGGSGVAGHVGEGFLGDAEEVGFEVFGEAFVESGGIVDVDACAIHEALGKPEQAGVEAKVIEDDGAQELREFAHVADGFIEKPEALSAAGEEIIGLETDEHGFEAGQRLTQLIVHLVGEPPGGGFLTLEHVPGDAVQFVGLPLHLAEGLVGGADGDDRAGEGQEEAASEQPEGLADEGTGLTFDLAFDGDGTFGVLFDDLAGEFDELLLEGRELVEVLVLDGSSGEDALGFLGEGGGDVFQLIPEAGRSGGSGALDDIADLGFDAVDFAGDVAGIGSAEAGDAEQDAAEKLLLFLEIVDETAGEEVFADEFGGTELDGAGMLEGEVGGSAEEEDDEGETNGENPEDVLSFHGRRDRRGVMMTRVRFFSSV